MATPPPPTAPANDFDDAFATAFVGDLDSSNGDEKQLNAAIERLIHDFSADVTDKLCDDCLRQQLRACHAGYGGYLVNRNCRHQGRSISAHQLAQTKG